MQGLNFFKNRFKKMNDIKNAYTWNRMFMNHDEDHQLSFKSAYVPEGLRCITNDLIIFIKEAPI